MHINVHYYWLYMCIEYHIQVNMYHVSAQGIDEHMINLHYYYETSWNCVGGWDSSVVRVPDL